MEDKLAGSERRGSGATLQGSTRQNSSEYAGQGTQESPYIVKFADGDKTNPLNWANTTKWLIGKLSFDRLLSRKGRVRCLPP